MARAAFDRETNSRESRQLSRLRVEMKFLASASSCRTLLFLDLPVDQIADGFVQDIDLGF